MYVCLHVGMYVCLNVGMYVCMQVCMKYLRATCVSDCLPTVHLYSIHRFVLNHSFLNIGLIFFLIFYTYIVLDSLNLTIKRKIVQSGHTDRNSTFTVILFSIECTITSLFT